MRRKKWERPATFDEELRYVQYQYQNHGSIASITNRPCTELTFFETLVMYTSSSIKASRGFLESPGTGSRYIPNHEDIYSNNSYNIMVRARRGFRKLVSSRTRGFHVWKDEERGLCVNSILGLY